MKRRKMHEAEDEAREAKLAAMAEEEREQAEASTWAEEEAKDEATTLGPAFGGLVGFGGVGMCGGPPRGSLLHSRRRCGGGGKRGAAGGDGGGGVRISSLPSNAPTTLKVQHVTEIVKERLWAV